MGLNRIRKYAILLAWAISIIATSGSLYLSEVWLFEPCKLCWIQRIFMYPLTVILGYSAITEDRKYARPAYIFACSGLVVGIYHYLGQKIKTTILPCTDGVPCSKDYLNWYGFITIPLLSLVAFALILVLLMIIRKED